MTPTMRKRRFHAELDKLQARLMEMSGLSEDLVRRAVDAFLTRDPSAARAIRDDDRFIDTLEMEVDEQVLELLALHQPVARDLRQILTIHKISNDVERVGDHAVNVAKAAARIARLPPLPEIPEFGELAVLAQRMLEDSLVAFGSRNSGLAREICTRDDRVDDMKKTVNQILLEHMEADSSRIPSAMEYFRAAQQLERIGDLSTNISEDVVFLVEGRSIKHNAERREGTHPSA